VQLLDVLVIALLVLLQVKFACAHEAVSASAQADEARLSQSSSLTLDEVGPVHRVHDQRGPRRREVELVF
jgi:hypothetical protein